MKKILHIQVLPKLSGAQKISFEIFKALPRNDFEKWILFSDDLDAGDKEACKKAFEQTGAKVLFSSKLKREICLSDIGATKEIYRLCKAERFDIVHTNSTKPGIIGRIAATAARVPLVIHTVHGVAFHKFIKFPKWHFYWACEMFASLFCHKIVMVNKFYGKYFKWFRKKSSTIYNGVDFSQLLPSEEKNEGKSCKVLFVGRLDEPKDPMTILRVANIVVAKYSDVKFTLVGDGEKANECRNYITENHLENNINLEGWQNNVAKYYASHDIFFAPSIFEAFGLMFVEAGFYSLPTISTNVEGIPEVIADGETGLLSDPRDIDGAAANLLRLIENRELRIEMGENSRKRVVELFSIETMTDQYLKMYNSK